jgi:ferredoxin
MAYMISCECINCTACEYECPVRAISPGPSQFTIDAATCVECDGYFSVPRCRSVCPVAACQPQREVCSQAAEGTRDPAAQVPQKVW